MKDTQPTTFSYQVGILLAINAVPDAYLVIDGPDCVYRKAEWIAGRHDLRSTLLDPLGAHRLATTLTAAEEVPLARGDEVKARLRAIARTRRASVAFVSAMPHVAILGLQYDKIVRELADELPFKLEVIPSRSLEGDWLDGYEETLTALARTIDPAGGDVRPERVAVIGHLMDRNEFDQEANVGEIERMLRGVGLDPVSVWLSGRPYEHLCRARDAATLLALPRGLPAAKALAERTGARVVEVPVPFGVQNTRAFLEAAAATLGRTARADDFIERELGTLVPRLEWAVQHYLVGKRVLFGGDPSLFPGIRDVCSEVGMELVGLLSTARGTPSELSDRETVDELDLVIGPFTVGIAVGAHVGKLQLGFPSFTRHRLYPRPFLGMQGWVALLDDVMHALATRDPYGAQPDATSGSEDELVASVEVRAADGVVEGDDVPGERVVARARARRSG